MTTFSTVDCAQEGATEENLDITTGHITARATLRCTWANRLYLADDLLINKRIWPYIFTASAPIALSATIVPGKGAWTIAGQGGTPKHALVTVNYGVPQTRSVGPHDVVAESIEPFGDFIRQDHTAFRWSGKSGSPISPDEAPAKFMPKCKIVRKIYKLNSIPAAAMTAFGKCNYAAYYSPLLGVTFPAETLLYETPNFERTITSSGTDGFNYTQNWVFNPQGWNRYFRAATGNYEYIYRVDLAGASVRWNSYEPIDLSGLLA